MRIILGVFSFFLFFISVFPTNLDAESNYSVFEEKSIPSYLSRLPGYPKIEYEGEECHKLNVPMLPVYAVFGFPLDLVDASFGVLNYIPFVGTFTTSAYMVPFVLSDKYDDENYMTTHYNYSRVDDDGKVKKRVKWHFFPIFNYHWRIKVVDEKRMNAIYQEIDEYNNRIDSAVEDYNKAVDLYKECLINKEEIAFINLNNTQSLDDVENEIKRFSKDYEDLVAKREQGLSYYRHQWMNKEELAKELEVQRKTTGMVKYDNVLVSYLDSQNFDKIKSNLVRYEGKWMTPDEKAEIQKQKKEGIQEIFLIEDEAQLKKKVDEEVLKLIKTEYEELGAAEVVGATQDSQFAQLTVINNFDKKLDVLVSGPQSKSDSVSPNVSNNIILYPGEYIIVFLLEETGQKPLVLSQQFDASKNYEISLGKEEEAPTAGFPDENSDRELRRARRADRRAQRASRSR